MMKLKIALQRGIGLIETLLIVLFASICVVALINFQHYLSSSTNSSQQWFDATILATSKVESLRDFQVLTNTAGYSSYQGISSGTSNSTVGNTSYTLTWTVTTNTNPNYKTIDVTVTWTDRFNTSQSVRLTSQVAGIDPAMSAAIK